MKGRPEAAFVGRARELGELGGALASARDASGTTVLLAGEAGIGKTRLASELAGRARDAGFDVLLGRSIDLVGTELPYQPFAEALRPLGAPWQADGRRHVRSCGCSRRRSRCSPTGPATRPCCWCSRTCTGPIRRRSISSCSSPTTWPASGSCCWRPAGRTSRPRPSGCIASPRACCVLARRSGSNSARSGDEELTALLAAQAGAPPPAGLTQAIAARSEGNPFFAEELLAAGGDENGELPRRLRDVLLQRVARLDADTQSLLRLAAAAGRDVGYALLQALAALPERDLRESLRRAVEHGVLVTDQASGSFRFRHALLAEAVYSTLLPGEREELHARLADELARSGAASPAELAPHWAAAGRRAEALAASVDAARQAGAVFGLAEAHAHLERALALWPAVPDAAELTGLDLAGLCAWTAELAGHVGAAPRAARARPAGD